MKKIPQSIVFIVILFSLFLSRYAMSAGIDSIKFHEIESGRIIYTLAGFQTGTETFVWKDYGRRTKRHTVSEINFMGVKQKNDQVVFTDGAWSYTLDSSTQTASKVENPILKAFAAEGKKDLMKTGEDMMRAMGGKVVGKDTVLGKACVLWRIEQMMNTTVCVWKGIGLMSTGGMQEMQFKQTATEIKTSGISDAEVSLPPGIKIVEGPDPFKQMQEQMQEIQEPGAQEIPKEMLEQLKKMQEEMQKQGAEGQ